MNVLWLQYLQQKEHSVRQSDSSVMALARKTTLWCSWLGTMLTAYIIFAQKVQSLIKTGFQNHLLLKYSWDPTNGWGNNAVCSLTKVPGWLQPRVLHCPDRQWWERTWSIGWKGLRRGWREKVIHSENHKYLCAGHGLAWEDREGHASLAFVGRKCSKSPKATFFQQLWLGVFWSKKGKFLSKYMVRGRKWSSEKWVVRISTQRMMY